MASQSRWGRRAAPLSPRWRRALAGAVTLLATTVAATSHANISISEQGVKRSDSDRKDNEGPFDVSRADCEGSDAFTFPLTVTADASAVIEVWIGEGSADCKTIDARQTNPICTKITSKPASSIVNNVLSFSISSKSIAGSLESVQGCTDSTVTTTARKVSLFFLVITDPSADATDATTWTKTAVDLLGPTAPTEVTAASAENAISLSWKANPSDDVHGYAFFCEASGSGTGGAAASGGGGTGGAGGDANGSGGSSSGTTNADCPSTRLAAGKIPPSTLLCGSVGKSNSGLAENLDNGTSYAVGVAATDLVGNTGDLSDIRCATPAPVDDFFELYRAYGGQAGGDYCNCVAAGADRRSAGPYAGAPLAALGLLALRRRRRPPASRRIERGAR